MPVLADNESLLTPKEAAQFLRLSLSWLAKARMRGDGPPYVKPGRSVRYRKGDLVQWLKSRARLSTSER
jgi:predicted DNA-binding transcriptional regulator AlpA